MNVIEQNIWGRRFLRKKIRNQVFEHTVFNEMSFKYVDFVGCAWTGCEFRNSHIGHNTTYTNCTWSNTTFSGKYSGFSGGRFEGCRFDKVSVQGGLMHGLKFSKCAFSGEFRNLIFVGEQDTNGWATRFEDCDLGGVILDNVSFVAGVDLGTVKLPASGIRVFANTDDAFTRALVQAAEQQEAGNAVPFSVLAQVSRGQELVVQDLPTFDYLFKDAAPARQVFESLAPAFEVPRNP